MLWHGSARKEWVYDQLQTIDGKFEEITNVLERQFKCVQQECQSQLQSLARDFATLRFDVNDLLTEGQMPGRVDAKGEASRPEDTHRLQKEVASMKQGQCTLFEQLSHMEADVSKTKALITNLVQSCRLEDEVRELSLQLQKVQAETKATQEDMRTLHEALQSMQSLQASLLEQDAERCQHLDHWSVEQTSLRSKLTELQALAEPTAHKALVEQVHELADRVKQVEVSRAMTDRDIHSLRLDVNGLLVPEGPSPEFAGLQTVAKTVASPDANPPECRRSCPQEVSTLRQPDACKEDLGSRHGLAKEDLPADDGARRFFGKGWLAVRALLDPL